tara:strand:+ start:511 stop:1074 length:564 start_codon:yes stop_codon:yes gene_type:complete
MVAANIFTGSLFGNLPTAHLQSWGISLATLLNGDISRLVTATFLSHDSDMFVTQFLFAAAIIGTHEWRRGTWSTLTLFCVTDIAGSLVIFFLIIAPLSGMDLHAADSIALKHDVGMSGGGFGLLGGIVAGMRQRWLIAPAVLVAIIVKFRLFPDLIADSLHIVTFILGFAIYQTILYRKTGKGDHAA